MADNKDIHWVAGILEGEGCFAKRAPGHNPVIQLCMTDADIVIRAANILGCHKVIEQKNQTKAGKKIYRTVLYGSKAIAWMLTLWTLMGARRRIQIEECVRVWKDHCKGKYKARTPYSRGAKIVWCRENVPSLTT